MLRSSFGVELEAERLKPTSEALQHPPPVVRKVKLQDSVTEEHVAMDGAGGTGSEAEPPRESQEPFGQLRGRKKRHLARALPRRAKRRQRSGLRGAVR